MRVRWMVFTVPLLAAAPSFASMTGGSSPAPPPQPTEPATQAQAQPEAAEATARQQAERAYGDAYNQIAKAKEDLEAGKDKNAQKKFKHALESAQEAVRLDPRYHEAWNAVGFCSRKLGNYDDALKAYLTCLDIKSDYAPAREYLGEAYVELGQIEKAKQQLVMLDHQNAAEEAKLLKSKIDGWQAAHPDSAAAAKPAAGAGQ